MSDCKRTATLRTIVYVDGYNLYYGLLRTSGYKWLNIHALFNNHIFPFKSPGSELVAIKYYTADIKAQFASHGIHSEQAQGQYHRALRSATGGSIEIISSYHTTERGKAIQYKEPPNLKKTVDIWRIEEKQTDVKIALQMYIDASKNLCDQIVLCTNDNDLSPALEHIKSDFPHIEIGLVVPRPDPRNVGSRPPAGKLKSYASWYLPHIKERALHESLFPNIVPGKRKPAIKPSHW
jgi:uncharacterized LabA/DUF88 family protein